MADTPISGLTTYSTYDSGLEIEVLNVADTTMASTGTNKKIGWTSSLLNFVASGTGHGGGSVPDPGGTAGTTHFLREDATWATLPTTGLTITQHASPITTDTAGSTITFNLETSDWHSVQLGQNSTLAVSNATTGQQVTLILQQASGASYTVTWFSGITWCLAASSTAPSMPTTHSAYLVVTLKCLNDGGSPTFLGFVAGSSAS